LRVTGRRSSLRSRHRKGSISRLRMRSDSWPDCALFLQVERSEATQREADNGGLDACRVQCVASGQITIIIA
jgi:hypothetical protein